MRQEWDYPPGRRTQRLSEPPMDYIEQQKPSEVLSWRHKKVKAAVNLYFASIILVLKVLASITLMALLYFVYVFMKALLSL